MPCVDILIPSNKADSFRAQQIRSIFDIAPDHDASLRWKGEIPLDEEPWNVGLIVGPSGAGKSTVAKQVFQEHYDVPIVWNPKNAMIDDFSDEHSVSDITDICASVGFSTIPAWLRPHRVLSTGEQFRADLARRILELPDPVVVDEFTSVVDRTVAQTASHAIQKYIRRHNRKFVAVGCHYDVIDWLQPDWILEPATMNFRRRSLR